MTLVWSEALRAGGEKEDYISDSTPFDEGTLPASPKPRHFDRSVAKWRNLWSAVNKICHPERSAAESKDLLLASVSIILNETPMHTDLQENP